MITNPCACAQTPVRPFPTRTHLLCLPSALLQALAAHENLIEVIVSEASLSAAAELSPDASTFVAWDFFLHDSQATPVLPGLSPSYNTTMRYIVEADSFLLEYLSKQQLALEVFEARGWDVRPLGVAHMPLQALLHDLKVGTGETTPAKQVGSRHHRRPEEVPHSVASLRGGGLKCCICTCADLDETGRCLDRILNMRP